MSPGSPVSRSLETGYTWCSMLTWGATSRATRQSWFEPTVYTRTDTLLRRQGWLAEQVEADAGVRAPMLGTRISMAYHCSDGLARSGEEEAEWTKSYRDVNWSVRLLHC